MIALENLLVEAEPLYLERAIDNFGDLKGVSASLKHANGKYILCNAESVSRDGIPIEDYIGLTAHDVGRITHRKRAVTDNAVAMDKKILAKDATFVMYKQSLLAHNKSIVIEEVCKRGVLGSKQQVTAILACAQDITHQAHPMFLFKLYESYLPDSEAIQHFLRYKKLDTLFDALPNREELLTLLAMRDASETNAIAAALNYSVTDIEHYQKQLRDKLPVIGLNEVLALLKWHDPDVAQDAFGGLEK